MAPRSPSRALLLRDFMPYRLSVAANAVSQVVARAYATRHGLSTQEWRLMAVLASEGALTQRDLVRLTKMDKVTVSRAARALEGRKLITRTEDVSDARSLCLTFTRAGRKLYEGIVPAALAAQREVLRGLTARERATLTSLLERVEARAEEVLSVV